MPDAALGKSFEVGGGAYEKHRPGFPVAAADWLVPAGGRRVVDLGAGTGKFTELLIGRAERVTAVEPSRSMLDQLMVKLPGAEALLGSAETIPLPDSCADAVVAAQAFHWFKREQAAAEIARILVPGGSLGMAWNSQDGSQEWENDITEIFHPGSTTSEHEPFAQLRGFGPAAERSIKWTETITRADYTARWRTVSSYLAADTTERSTMMDRVAHILDTHPETSGRDNFTLRQQTYCVRMSKRR